MEIHDYETIGGKNLIKEYISTRPMYERREIYRIRHEIILYGLVAFQELNTRRLRGKLYEIKLNIINSIKAIPADIPMDFKEFLIKLISILSPP